MAPSTQNSESMSPDCFACCCTHVNVNSRPRREDENGSALGHRKTDQKALRLEGDSQPPTPLGRGAVLKYCEVTNVNTRKPQTTRASATDGGLLKFDHSIVSIDQGLTPTPSAL